MKVMLEKHRYIQKIGITGKTDESPFKEHGKTQLKLGIKEKTDESPFKKHG